MGHTKIRYGDPGENFLEELVFNPEKQKEFYNKFVFRKGGNSGNRDRGGSSSGDSGGRNKRYGKQISRVFGEFIGNECHGVILKVIWRQIHSTMR